MRYGIISDIHGNLEALQAVLKDCRKQHVDALLCPGDTVGYGAQPQECLELLKECKTFCIAGNHDWAVAGKLDPSYFTEDGKAALLWTRTHLSLEWFDFLRSLPLQRKNNDLILVHGTLHEPTKFSYLFNGTDAPDTFALMDRKICFVGHTHVPQIIIQQGQRMLTTQALEMELQEDCKYIINPGSIGQSRDGSSKASYCIYDSSLELVELKRVQYDIEITQKKIRDAGLPESLANRLALGK